MMFRAHELIPDQAYVVQCTKVLFALAVPRPRLHTVLYGLAPPFVVPGSASLPHTMRESAACHIIAYHSMLTLNSPIHPSIHPSILSRAIAGLPPKVTNCWCWRIGCCWLLYEPNFRQPSPLPVVAVRASSSSSRCPTIDFTNTPLVPTPYLSCLRPHVITLINYPYTYAFQGRHTNRTTKNSLTPELVPPRLRTVPAFKYGEFVHQRRRPTPHSRAGPHITADSQ